MRSLTLVLSVFVFGACSSKRPAPAQNAIAPPSSQIVVDGDVGEWGADTALVADNRFIYFRVAPGSGQTLQAGSESLVVLLDTDADASTGAPPPGGIEGLGVDLEIHCTPLREDGTLGSGVAVYVNTGSGTRVAVSHSDVGFHFAPTTAADWFEGRISRHPRPGLGLPAQSTSGAVRAAFAVYAEGGELLGWSDPLAATLPATSETQGLGEADLPAKPEGALRIVSWNVLRSAPMSDAQAFANMMTALDADIYLFQEWDEPSETIESWMRALVPGGSDWNVHRGSGWGVSVAARYPIASMPIDDLYVEESDRPVRFVAAEIDTPLGLVAAGSIHLKCCGSGGSPEDTTRIREAEAINDALEGALRGSAARIRVFGGDFNLVGTYPPLDIMRDQLDLGGASLRVAEPMLLGDNAMYTWREDVNAFSPGRLDYIVYGEMGADLMNAFVVDTRRLGDASLARMGLYRADSASSDHLPVVVDLRPSR